MADTDYEDAEEAGDDNAPGAQSHTTGSKGQRTAPTDGRSKPQQSPQEANSPTRKKGNKKQPPCNCRIDELARPKRWLILNTWKEHGFHFEPERSQALREKVQEEFFMTPEETAAYLAQVRQQQQKSRLNDRVRKAELRREAKAARRAADLFVQKRIKRGLIYAYQHPPPILMTPMLRSISDKVLEELCTLHDVPMPKRGDTDKHSRYLLSASDWTAILTANIYYEVNVKEKEDIDRLMEADRGSYIDSEEALTDDKGVVKKEPKVKQEQNRPAADQRYAPSEKQMGVTNYDDDVPLDNVKQEPGLDELDPIDEEGG